MNMYVNVSTLAVSILSDDGEYIDIYRRYAYPVVKTAYTYEETVDERVFIFQLEKSIFIHGRREEDAFIDASIDGITFRFYPHKVEMYKGDAPLNTESLMDTLRLFTTTRKLMNMIYRQALRHLLSIQSSIELLSEEAELDEDTKTVYDTIAKYNLTLGSNAVRVVEACRDFYETVYVEMGRKISHRTYIRHFNRKIEATETVSKALKHIYDNTPLKINSLEVMGWEGDWGWYPAYMRFSIDNYILARIYANNFFMDDKYYFLEIEQIPPHMKKVVKVFSRDFENTVKTIAYTTADYKKETV